MASSIVRLAAFACVAGVASALGLACGSADKAIGPPGKGNVQIVIAPESSAVVVGASTTLTASARDASGATVSGLTFFWSSSDSTVAKVDQSGTVSSRGPGKVQIAASAQGASGVATVVVEAAAIGAVIVAPAVATLRLNATLQLTDTAKDATGKPLVGEPVAWFTDNAAVATVDTNGLVIAQAIGTAHISAAVEGKVGTATITVTAVPVASVSLTPPSATLDVRQTTQFTATPLDSAGNALTGRTITWQSGTPSAATVSTTGLVKGVAPGTSVIRATSEGQTGTATVTVHPAPVSAVELSPATSSVLIGQSEKLSAQVTDVSGVPIAGAAVTFSSTNKAIATVNPTTGVVLGVATGTTTITGTSGGKTGKATVTVLPVPVASVVITPPSETMVIGSQVTLQAKAQDSAGHQLLGRPTTWTSSAPKIATVSTAGVVHAVAAGSTVITARIGGVAGTASVVVQEVPVGSVTITPPTATVQQGLQQALKVVVRDRTGAIVTDRPVTWLSTNISIATVSSAGLVNALNLGVASIIATVQGVADTATITVVPAAVASITVTPNPASVLVQSTVTLTATAHDANGKVLTGRAIQWTSSATTIATVDATTGVVTGVAPGTVTVSATSGSVSGTATVTVGTVPIASVKITPTDVTITSAQTTQLTATVTNAVGAVVSAPVPTWSSAPVGRVSSSGLVTPRPTDGGTTITVTATAGGKSGTATVHVTNPPPVPVASITVTPNPAAVQVHATVTLTATLRDGSGNVLTGRAVQWTSGTTGVATVGAASGVVTGVAQGSATVSATSGGVTGTATVNVTNPPPAPVASVTVAPNPAAVQVQGTVTLTATLRDAGNNVLTGRAIQWTSGATGIATVNAASGVVTGVAPGSATVSATSGGVTGSATVQVAPVPISSVSLAPTDTTITSAQTAQLRAKVTDALGHVVSSPAPTWSSAPSGRVSSSGLVTPQTADEGNAITVTATAGGKSGTATVHVTAPFVPVASVTVSPQSDSIFATSPGNTLQLTDVTKSGTGTVLTGRPVTWSSSSGIASVSSGGLVTAGNTVAGSATITATSADGPSGSAAIGVIGHVATVTVTPNPLALSTGGSGGPTSATLAAALTDTFGSNVTGQRSVTWSSSDSTIATVDNTGLVTAVGVSGGTVQITVTSDGVTGTATVNVSP